MALLTRIGQLFRADMHAVLDSIEEPAEVLRQSIRDMQEVIGDGESEVRDGDRQLAGLGLRVAATETEIRNLDRELETCFQTEEHDLARAVIRKKLKARTRLKGFAAAIENLEACQADRTSTLARQREIVEALRQKADIVVGADPNDSRDSGARLSAADAVSDDDVEIAFLQEQRARAAS